MNDYEMVWNFLREFFNYEHYAVAIRKARNTIANDQGYQENWQRIAHTILNRGLLHGQPLTVVQEGANQVLDENSDEEAYRWLEKMLRNIERNTDEIEEY